VITKGFEAEPMSGFIPSIFARKKMIPRSFKEVETGVGRTKGKENKENGRVRRRGSPTGLTSKKRPLTTSRNLGERVSYSEGLIAKKEEEGVEGTMIQRN